MQTLTHHMIEPEYLTLGDLGEGLGVGEAIIEKFLCEFGYTKTAKKGYKITRLGKRLAAKNKKGKKGRLWHCSMMRELDTLVTAKSMISISKK